VEREAKKIQQEPSHIAEGIQGKGLTLGEEEAVRLDAQPKIKVYRAMQEHDGKLYPPTSGMIQEEYTDKNGDEKTDEKERYDRASGAAEPVTEEEAALRDAVSGLLRNAGIEVIDDVEEGQRVLDRANEVLLSKDKKRALETASLGETSRSLTAIPSALGSKILNNLDTLVTKCKNSSTQPKTFIGEVADALGIPQERFKDKSSRYATFETKNGNIVTIRISDHNATASNLDVNGQEDVISIVVSNKPNKGINNDGKSHIVEYYYNAIKLRKADGKPLAAIVRSIQQALYSGEYKDTTGLAERQEVNAVDVIKYYRSQRSKLNGRAMARRGRGYVEEENGRLISRRAKEAEEDGSFPKQKFISHYKVSNRGFRLLSKLGLIGYAGWHHTGNSFKKTDYYGWSEEPFADAYSKNKKDLEEIEKRLEETPVNEGDGIQSDAGRLLERYCDLMGYHDEIREFHIKLYLQDAYREKQLNEALKELGLDSKDVKFFRTQNGEAYGFIAEGKIYLDPRIAKADTPIHEYTHLWTEALRNANPKEWQNVVELMKDTWAWDYVKESYPELEGDDEIADEALAHFSGRQGAKRLREAAKDEIAKADGILGEAAVWSAFNKVKTALKNFWRGVADLLHIHFTSAEEVADKVMYDLLNRVKPGGDRSYSSNRRYREDRSDSSEDVEAVNVPVAKMFGKSQRTRKQRAAFAARERENMEATVRDLAEKLHLSNVEINTSGEAGNTRMARAKGYFNKKTGKIVIKVRNHRDAEDAKKTLLHEGVAHYGLRKFLGDKFDGTLSVIDADDKDAVSYVNVENERRKALAKSLGRSYDEVSLIENAFFMDEFWYCRYLGPDGTILWEGESPYPDRSHPFCICATPFIGGKIQSYMRDAIDHNILINRTIILQDWLIRTIVS